jgi:hypothetical protein
MHKCIRSIKGRASDSSSDTDTWIATLAKGTTFKNDYDPESDRINISCAFLKIGVNPASIRIQPGDEETFVQREAQFEKRVKAALGLQYEFQVYETIIRPILDNSVCCLFLRPYLASYNCRYEDLRTTLAVGLADLPQGKVEAALDRNLSFIIKGPKAKPIAAEAKEAEATDPKKARPEKRKAIDDLPPDDEVFDKPSPDMRYMVLTTEYGKKTYTYNEFLRRVANTYSKTTVATQILIALYVMEKSKLMHNDLHGLNILIEEYDDDKAVVETYEIEDIPSFSMFVAFRVKIFDFDHASCALLGPNALWQTNGFEANTDLACLFRWLLARGQTIVDKSLLGRLFDGSSIVADYEQVAQTGQTDLRWCDAKGVQIKGSILGAIKDLASWFNRQKPLSRGFTFVINSDVFMANGTIYQEHTWKTRAKDREVQYKAVNKLFMEEVQKCKGEQKELMNRVAEMNVNIQQLQRALRAQSQAGPLSPIRATEIRANTRRDEPGSATKVRRENARQIDTPPRDSATKVRRTAPSGYASQATRSATPKKSGTKNM